MKSTAKTHESRIGTPQRMGPERGVASTVLAFAFVIGSALIGWLYLSIMIADMVPVMDMGRIGPGMHWLNRFNLFAGLPPDVRAVLSVICLPNGMTTFGMPDIARWGPRDLLLVFLMWEMMVFAMMIPTAVPMLLAYSRHCQAQNIDNGGRAVLMACLGYLAVWTGFSVVATAFQWGLTQAGAVDDMMAPVLTSFALTTLLAAAVYQLTPFKRSCLDRCRYPALSLKGWQMRQSAGHFSFGFEEGRNCLGCCWALMIAMFAVGVMNLLWIGLLAGFMVLEKTSSGVWAPRLVAVVLLLLAGTAFLGSGHFLSPNVN